MRYLCKYIHLHCIPLVYVNTCVWLCVCEFKCVLCLRYDTRALSKTYVAPPLRRQLLPSPKSHTYKKFISTTSQLNTHNNSTHTKIPNTLLLPPTPSIDNTNTLSHTSPNFNNLNSFININSNPTLCPPQPTGLCEDKGEDSIEPHADLTGVALPLALNNSLTSPACSDPYTHIFDHKTYDKICTQHTLNIEHDTSNTPTQLKYDCSDNAVSKDFDQLNKCFKFVSPTREYDLQFINDAEPDII
eukprot:GHVR01111001.1.p1 GENE.GHVR01111001.1~~GHVR01111001.1.p1  ORF type:complete len:244 (-),score=46.36 GHVR01111001.1:204-935(-)